MTAAQRARKTTTTTPAAAANKYTPSEGSLGKNVDYTLTADGILTMTVDLNGDHGPSASGKTIVIATSSGNKEIAGGSGAVIGFNAYRKP